MNNKQEEMEETNMKMIKAIVRPEKSEDVLDAPVSYTHLTLPTIA